MTSSRIFWIFATIIFSILWFVAIPYLASNPHIDLTAPVSKSRLP